MKKKLIKGFFSIPFLIFCFALIFSCASTKKKDSDSITSMAETSLDSPDSVGRTEGASVPLAGERSSMSGPVIPEVEEEKKKAKEAELAEQAERADSETVAEEEETPSDKKKAKKEKPKKVKETKEEKKARKEREKLLKKQKQDQYTGWIYIPEKNFTITNDDVRIEMRGSSGSFGLYAINEAGKSIPLLVNYDSFNSTFLAVKIGRKVYRLNRENGVKCEARRTPYGAQMAYTIPKEAQIVIDFSFLPSIATSSRVDMVRVTIYTINLGKTTQSFTEKAVFDTFLGETAFTHFSTAARSKIDTEVQFTNMIEERWVRSANGRATVQFLLNGKGITSPQYVTLSSKDSLSNTNWIPMVQDSKSFNSVVAYNNSALGINWKTAYLDPLKSDIITFYISVSTDGNEPAGKAFLASLAAGKTALSAKIPDSLKTTTVAPTPLPVPEEALATAYHENMPVIPGKNDGFDTSPLSSKNGTAQGKATFSDNKELKNVTPEASPELKEDKASSNIPASYTKPKEDPYAALSTDPTLDPEYIQNLLDKIASLSNDGSVSQEEIDRLNRELDEILIKLEQMP